MPITVADHDEPGRWRAAGFMRNPAARPADTYSADLPITCLIGCQSE